MFTRSDLDTLVAQSPATGVSIFLPTHVVGRETRQGPVRLKNLIKQAQQQLESAEIDAKEGQALLAPAVALIDDYDFWQHQNRGLALFLQPGDMQMHKLPLDLSEEVRIGPGFHVRPLLTLLSADGTFTVLTITADDVRLYSASRLGIQEEDSSALPRELDEVKGEPDHENSFQATPIGRPRVGSLDVSKAQVQGLSPEDWRKKRRVEYVGRIALALKERMATHPAPVIVVADAETSGHFKQNGALGTLLVGTIAVNPDSLDETGLHSAAYEVIRPQLEQKRWDAIQRFETLHGQGDAHAASLIEDISIAAFEGRIDTLLVRENAQLNGQPDVSSGHWQHGPAGTVESGHKQGPKPDGLNAVLVHTLRQGGEVYVLPADQMPSGLFAAAILRY